MHGGWPASPFADARSPADQSLFCTLALTTLQNQPKLKAFQVALESVGLPARDIAAGRHCPAQEVFMPRILVVDDQADVRAMIAMVLRIHHFEVVEAAGSASGLKAFEEASFDLAIVDIFLSGSNGYEVIVAMRERVPHLPIVAISGMTALEFVAE